MPEPLSAEREVEIRAHIERERGWSVGADMATDLLSAHDYHRAAATRAQAELEQERARYAKLDAAWDAAQLELAQALERERGLREALIEVSDRVDYADARDHVKLIVKDALAGGKDGA